MPTSPKFGASHHVFADKYIDDAGLHDGLVVHRWDDLAACSIGESDPAELKAYFGDDYDEHPFAIILTRKDGARHEITLFGQDWDKVVAAGEAINHYSGRQFIPAEQLQGKTMPASVVVAILLLTILLMAIAFLK